MAAAPRARTVLVVDDSDVVLELYSEVLEGEGHVVVLRSRPPADPGDILALGPDLILLDLRIGREDTGWRFLRALKVDARTAGIPVLVCTTDHALAREVEEQLTAWDCGVVLKPFEVEDLLAKVRECLGKGDARSPAVAGTTEAASP